MYPESLKLQDFYDKETRVVACWPTITGYYMGNEVITIHFTNDDHAPRVIDLGGIDCCALDKIPIYLKCIEETHKIASAAYAAYLELHNERSE
jgi:hypothetical protein